LSIFQNPKMLEAGGGRFVHFTALLAWGEKMKISRPFGKNLFRPVGMGGI
jgi:hypothetical protein